MSLGMVPRWPDGNEGCVSDTGREVIDGCYPCASSVERGFPRLRHSECVLVEHPSSVETEVVDLVDVVAIVNTFKIAALHTWRNDIGDSGNRSSEPCQRRDQTIAPLRVTFRRGVGESEIMSNEQQRHMGILAWTGDVATRCMLWGG